MLVRPRIALVIGALWVALAAVAATQLHTGSPERLLAKSGSGVGAATRAQERAFGGEPVVVNLRGELQATLSGANLRRLVRLEQRLRRLDGVQTVFGPGTFVDQAVAQMYRVVQQELGAPAGRAAAVAALAVGKARAAGVRDPARLTAIDQQARLRALPPALRKQYQALLVRFSTIGLPSLDNRNFVMQLVMGAGVAPKRRFGWLFPDRRHALVIVRLRAGLGDARVRALGPAIERRVRTARLSGVTTSVSGAPLAIAAASDSIGHELWRLAPVGLVAMALALLLGLGLRARALHLLVPAILGVAVTVALSWPLGLGFTLATLAALPVILGLGVDYAIQLQARYWDERARRGSPRAAAQAAVRGLGPTLALAAGAMGVGFLALLLSPVPLINRLGLTLAIGVGASLAAALVLGGPLMVLCDRAGVRTRRLPVRVPLRATPAARLALTGAIAIAAAGLVLSADAPVQSDLRKLARPEMAQLRALEDLQRELGTSGQIRVAITARDVTDPRVLGWMAGLEPELLALDRNLRPGPNLAAILASGDGGAQPPSAASVRRLLRLVPPAFVGAVLARDHRRAELSFGVPLASAADQARLIARMQRVLDGAPAGLDAQAAGLLALSAAGVSDVEAERPWLLLAAAAAMVLLLFAVRRRLDRALIPVAPALLAAGVTSLVVAAADVSLSPLSAGLDPLVLAVGVEFGILLEARYRERRAAGEDAHAAAHATVGAIGPPVLLSAGTVGLGFAVLALSDLPVLRQFGLVAVLELVLCVVAALLLVPALAAAADGARRAPRRPPAIRCEEVGAL